MNKKSPIHDQFDEEDWNEDPSSIFTLSLILDELQSGKINDEEIRRFVEVKSEVSSKNDPVKELLFLKEYVSLLSGKINSIVYQRLLELKKEKIKPDEKETIIQIDKELLKVSDVAKELDLSRQQVYNYINDGTLKSYQIGGKGLRVSRQDLDRFISTKQISKD